MHRGYRCPTSPCRERFAHMSNPVLASEVPGGTEPLESILGLVIHRAPRPFFRFQKSEFLDDFVDRGRFVGMINKSDMLNEGF